MTMNVTPHLNFRGDARAALEWYQSVFGGDLTVVTYADLGGAQEQAEAQQVMWGQVESDSGFRIMAFDVLAPRPWDQGENAFFVSVRVDDADELTACWARLEDGADVLVPLAPAQWAPLYGMLTDRFGVTWVMDVAVDHSGA